ncbi:MAG: hypothetical protein ACR2QE_16715, partial [Acidimicrobiales bacterium]
MKRFVSLSSTIAVLALTVALIPSAGVGAQPPLNGGGGWTSYPDLNGGNIPPVPADWNSLADIAATMNNARAAENADICPGGTCEPGAQVMPTDLAFPAGYAAMTPNEKGLWMVNQERTARGLLPFTGIDPPVVTVAQGWAQHLSDTGNFDHNMMAATQITAACTGCAGNFGGVAENLYRRSAWGTPAVILDDFGVESAIWGWMYNDLNSQWGHRHALLWNNMSNDHGAPTSEGFVGFGVVRKPITVGQFEGQEETVVWNAIDTNANYPLPQGSTCNGLTVTVDLNMGQAPTAGDDVVLGTPNADSISAGGGNDTICGGGGNDTINAGVGNDWVDGGDGNDTVFGQDGDDTLQGGPGDDQLLGFGDNDTIDGGPGADTLNGGPGDDNLSGGDENDQLYGQGGNDTVTGGNGDDFIIGVDGTDNLSGDAGDDTINGGPGDDIVSGGADNDTIYGLTGNDQQLNGDAGNDFVFGQVGNDTVDGGPGDDNLWGNEQNDTITDPSGVNVINGGPDNDNLTGGSGNDQIFGDGTLAQAGDDTIVGAGGNDLLNGCAGDDTIDSEDGVADVVNCGPHTT